MGKETQLVDVHGTTVERRSLAGELPCPALDLQLMGDHLYG